MTVAEVKPLRLKSQRVERKQELSQNVVDVLVDTPIHHLDQLYTYAIPENLDSAIQFGVFLSVDFNGRPTTGIAIEKRLRNSKDAHLSPVKDLISPDIFMNQWQWEMINTVADQCMASRNAILRFAIPQPTRVKKIKEASSTLAHNDKAVPEKKSKTRSGPRIALVTHIGTDSIKLLVSALKKERSALVIVPDERDLERIRKLFHEARIETKEYGSHNSKNSNLATYLAAISGTSGIYIGTRMAVWLPVSGPLYMLNDVDSSYAERKYPYFHARDIALVRSQFSSYPTHFVGPAPSLELSQRISTQEINCDYRINLRRDITVRTAPDSFHETIKSGLQRGSVLVQVAAKGYYNSLFCQQCKNRPLCECGGRITLLRSQGSAEKLACSLCAKTLETFQCTWCQSSRLKKQSKGSDRIAYEIGKAFPKIAIAISTKDNTPEVIHKNTIVISTPGAEPYLEEGFSAIVLTDCEMLLNRPLLRSEEFARLHWRTALAQLQQNGYIYLDLPHGHREVQSLIRGNYFFSINQELSERKELRLPPFVSILRLSGTPRVIAQLHATLTSEFSSLSIHKEAISEKSAQLIVRAPFDRLHELKKALSDMQRIRSAKKLEPINIEVDPLDL